ncbi:GNAT family N-acetyltransferase [Sporolactobacillus vineae]|uniref:GNAT family N-acetyltransferase n=1 Tax=Sporolactobacillus vineae TaxID=444463 RepID=UPI0002891713|nr:GNAT family N-acetyltransferase [Sporolactobacillus vineae]
MNDKLVIRDAVMSDLPEIVRIYNETIPGRMVTADTTEVTVEERTPWLAAHLKNRNRPFWIAQSGGHICGWLSLSTFYGRPAYQGTVEISVYIDASFRHTGIGSSLIRRAMKQAGQYKIRTILAFIFGQNLPSLHLFKKLGFAQWGRFPKVAELDGVERDLLILGKRVDDKQR